MLHCYSTDANFTLYKHCYIRGCGLKPSNVAADVSKFHEFQTCTTLTDMLTQTESGIMEQNFNLEQGFVSYSV